jgi:hypothetical protein
MKPRFSEATSPTTNPTTDIKDLINMTIIKDPIIIVKEMYQNGSTIRNHLKN